MSRRHVNRVGARPSYSRQGSAYSKRPQLPQLPWLARRFWVWVATGITATLLILVLIAHATTIQTITIKGQNALTREQVTHLTREGLKQQWLGRNLMLVNTAGLASYLHEHESGIKSVSIKRHLPHTLEVSIIERQPALNWKTAGNVYLLDADGTIIGLTKGEYSKLPMVTDSNNLPVKVGDRVVPSTFVAFCSELVALLPTVGYQVSGMTIPASTSEVYIQTSTQLSLKFDTTRSAAEEIGDLKQVQIELKRTKKSPTQYIDLRIPHKAYYK